MFFLVTNYIFTSPKEVVQSDRITPNEAEVTSLNLSPLSCVDMSKKKKKTIYLLDVKY
jgi:hypothetical protein